MKSLFSFKLFGDLSVFRVPLVVVAVFALSGVAVSNALADSRVSQSVLPSKGEVAALGRFVISPDDARSTIASVKRNDSQNREILFIDAAVPDRQALLQSVSSNVDVVTIDGWRGGLEQIADALGGRSDIKAIHIVSHGESGRLMLGASVIDTAALERAAPMLSAIGTVLSDDGDILLYGCDVAAGSEGRVFIEKIANATGADIAASNDITGGTIGGGDWELEELNGLVTAAIPFTKNSLDNYRGVLLAFNETFELPTGINSGDAILSTDTPNYSTYTLGGIEFRITMYNEGDGIQFQYWDQYGSGNSPSVDFESISIDNATQERFTIARSDGQPFIFTSIWADEVFSEPVTFTASLGGTPVYSRLVDYTNPVISATGDIVVDTLTFTSVDFGAMTIDDFIGNSEVNTAPTISIDNTTLAYTEDDPITQIDSAATLSDSDGDADWNGGTLEVQVTTNNEATDEISIPDNVVGTINTSGLNLLNGATTIGTLSASEGTVTNGTRLTITFNASATNSLVQQVLRSIHYRNTSNDPGTSNRTVTFAATDKNAASASDTRTVSVAATNDNPVITSNGGGATAAVAINENTTTVTTVTASDVDSGDTLSYSISGGDDSAKFTINSSNGILAFTSAPDYETATDSGTNNVYDVQVTVTDSGAGNLTDVQDIAVTVNNVNDAPVITGQGTLTTPEDTPITITLGDLTVIDQDNSYPTGFTLTLNSGTNYTRSGNILTPVSGYIGDLTVPATVNDGTSDSAVFNLLVTVTPGNSAPTISGSPVTVVSGHTPYSFIPDANDIDGDSLTFSIQNMPTWAGFNTSTGELYGTPTNSDVGTTGNIVISVSDGELSTSLGAFDLTVAENLDIDGDGMPNDWETANGFDPLDASDAALDKDGDGLSNLEEYLVSKDPAVDDNPPLVTPPAEVTVDATGLFTDVDIGTATAEDALDGVVSATSDAPERFTPGVHTVTWSAVDNAGNTGTATQTVNVRPLVSFGKPQEVAEGGGVNVHVYLNGPAADYPVSVPYTVSGSAATDGSDHNLSDGSINIASGTEGSISFTTVNDGAGEGSEQVVITMGTPVNAARGMATVHTVELSEGNVAPLVSLHASQGAGSTSLVVNGDGAVTVTSSVSDSNPADSHSYDWSGSDNVLVDTDGSDDMFTFDPVSLTPGVYTVRLSVSDGTASGVAELSLNVVASAPSLSSTSDSDGDGSNDQAEGYEDSDDDGVANYLDAIEPDNVLQGSGGVSDNHLIESEPGLLVRLGDIALQSGSGQASVTINEITALGGFSADSGYSYIGGLFDFSIELLPVAGQSAQVVLPQRAAIPAAAVYRKLIDGIWQDFVIDANNSVASAAGEEGYCPPPGDAAYRAGLTEGHWCVQLTIEDGGPNDADASANRRIVDPGGVASATDGLAAGDVRIDGGGGATSLWWLLLLPLWLWALPNRKAYGRMLAGKGSAFAVLMVVSLLSPPLSAEWYAGMSLGFANGDSSRDELNQELESAGLDARVSSNDDTRHSWQLFAEYRFTPRWGVEAAYLDLGDIDTTLSGDPADVDALLESSRDIHPNTAEGFVLAATFRQSLFPKQGINGVARLGAFAWESSYTLQTTSTSREVDDSGVDLMIGLGLETELGASDGQSQPLLGSINWNRYEIDGESVDALLLSLSLRFP